MSATFQKRIVITGLGAVTPAGNSPAALWEALVEGRSAVKPVPEFACAGARPAYAAAAEFTPEEAGLPRKRLKMMGRQAQLAYAATTQACADGDILEDGRVDKRRLGLILGVGMLNADVEQIGRAFHATAAHASNGSFHLSDFGQYGVPELFPLWLLRHIPNLAAAHASISLDAQGPSNTISTGCVAALNAIGEAARIIARGDADVILGGGCDARLTPLSTLRYRELGWLSTRNDVEPAAVSAPFDASASGFVNAEGAAVLVVESLDHARARGARILAEIAGYGAANDAYDVMAPHPEGRGLATALERCLRRGGLEASAIDALFAPAQAVPAFDRATAAALGHVFRATGATPAITATRAVLGHTHAASTAIDAVAAVTALADGRVPPTLNLRCPVADLPFVRGAARVLDVRTALVAGYGFGGHAAALALRRYSA